METLGDYLLFVFIFAVLLIAYGAVRAAAKKGLSQDEINRNAYQKRNDVKGGVR